LSAQAAPTRGSNAIISPCVDRGAQAPARIPSADILAVASAVMPSLAMCLLLSNNHHERQLVGVDSGGNPAIDIELLARIDLVHDWIAQRIDAHR
jgi:hypothetical protein